MKRRFATLACAVLLACAGCRDASDAPRVDGELALRYAQGNYDLGPRVFRTDGANKSAEWIKKQAVEMPGLLESGGQEIGRAHV